MTDDVASICEKCGASVYKHHLDSGIARYEKGNLLCAHCVAEYERSHDVLSGADDQDFEAISLDEDATLEELAPAEMSGSRIMASTQTLGVAGGWDDSQWKRSLTPTTDTATRCRTFHAKLSDNSLKFMNTLINDWVDGDENIVIKFATSTIGIFEGKQSEPNLILTLFY